MKKLIVKLSSMCILLITFTFNGFGQGEANNWVFGINLTLDFSTSPPSVIYKGQTQGNGGTSESTTSISDKNGNLLFASCGTTIFDKDFNSVYSGLRTTIDATQGNLVIPVPGTTNQYYISTVDAVTTACCGSGCTNGTNRGHNYSKITLNGANTVDAGSIGGNVNLTANNVTEMQAACPSDHETYWLINHELGNNRFNVFEVTSTGINFSNSYNVGVNISSCGFVGMLKFNGCYTKLAMTNSGETHLFDFNYATGAISNPINWAVTSPYGLEFSTNGDYLFVGSSPESSAANIFQYDISTAYPSNTGTSGAAILGTQANLGTPAGMSGRVGHIELGPDGNIYVAQFFSWGSGGAGPFYLGRISDIDNKPATFTSNAITISGNGGTSTPTYSLPSFLKSYVTSNLKILVGAGKTEISETDICEDNSILFDFDYSGGAEAGTGHWTINGVSKGIGTNPVSVIFPDAGTFPVKLQFNDQCKRPKTHNTTVTVRPNITPDYTVPATRCPNTNITITGTTGTGGTPANYVYYSASTGGTQLGSGATYVYNGALPHSNIWIEDASPKSTNAVIGTTAPTNDDAHASHTASMFTTMQTITINSIDLKSATWSTCAGTATIVLKKAGLVQAGYSKTVTITCGSTYSVPLNWSISAGNYSLEVSGVAFLWSSAAGTSSVANIISLVPTGTDYGPFYNWRTSIPNPCKARKQVSLTNSCCALPAQPSVISGDGTYCLGDETYLVTNVPGLTYEWTASAGGTVAATTTNTATITWTTTGAKTVSVKAKNGCGLSLARELSITVGAVPAKPTAITGIATTCPGDQGYSVPNLGATYEWSVNGAATFVSTNIGAGVTVKWPAAGGTFTLSAIAKNACGNSLPIELPVTVNSVPAKPTAITGNATTCPGDQGYSVPNLGATYEWTVNGAATFVSTNIGASVTVKWPATGGTFTLSAIAKNACGNSLPIELPVTVNSVPAKPTAITGNATTCPGDQGYSVPNLGATYEWTVNGGATFVSTNIGAGVTVKWPATGGTFTLSAIAKNACGNSLPIELPVTVNSVPAQPSIITGDNLYCISIEKFSVITDPNVTSYTWSVLTGGSVSGLTTNNANINWIESGSHILRVIPNNACGAGPKQELTVNVLPNPETPSAITGNINPCPGEQPYSVVPVAGITYDWDLDGGGTLVATNATATVDWITPKVGAYTLSVIPRNACGTGLPQTLFVTVNSGNSATISTAINGSINHCLGDQPYSIPNEGYSYKWSLPDGGGSFPSGNTGTNVSVKWDTPTATGLFHTLTVTPANACGDGTPRTLKVTVNANPTITLTDLSQTICSGSTSGAVPLNSNVTGTTFNWTATSSSAQITGYTASANGVTSISSQNITNAGTSQGSVTYTLTAAGPTGCPGTASATYTTLIDASAIANVSSFNIAECSASPTLPGLQPPYGTITWERVTGFGTVANPTQYNSVISGMLPMQSGTFKMNVTNGKCTASSSIVTVTRSGDETPSVTLAQSESVICEGSPVTFTATGNGGNSTTRTFEFIDAITGAILQPASVTGIMYTTNPGTTLNVKVRMVSNSTCLAPGALQNPESLPKKVIVVPATQTTQPVLGSEVCAGHDATITISNSQLNVRYVGYIGTSQVTTEATGTGSTITLNVPAGPPMIVGTNTISIRAFGCNEQPLNQQASIIIVPLPIADAGADVELTEFQPVTLNGTGSTQGIGYTYLWESSDPSATISNSGILTPTVNVSAVSSTFYLTVKSAALGGCSSTDEMNINLDVKISIPNVFSPNGDGIHDLFEIKNAEFYANAKMMIYNQWGVLIYESEDGYKKPWDGKKGNGAADIGTYYYIFEPNQEGLTPISGSVTIIK
jgi:gliding motility-associated-like protein